VLLQAIANYSVAAQQASADTLAAGERPARRLAERAPAYLDHCRNNVMAMREALERDDFEAVTILGHNMRGSGGGFGFQAITDFGAGLELAAGNADGDGARTLLDALSDYLGNVEIAV
jgi:HPt (histidine-containing phosphotransfer) domain-containing protein